jgi:hypothetical protein
MKVNGIYLYYVIGEAEKKLQNIKRGIYKYSV